MKQQRNFIFIVVPYNMKQIFRIANIYQEVKGKTKQNKKKERKKAVQ